MFTARTANENYWISLILIWSISFSLYISIFHSEFAPTTPTPTPTTAAAAAAAAAPSLTMWSYFLMSIQGLMKQEVILAVTYIGRWSPCPWMYVYSLWVSVYHYSWSFQRPSRVMRTPHLCSNVPWLVTRRAMSSGWSICHLCCAPTAPTASQGVCRCLIRPELPSTR